MKLPAVIDRFVHKAPTAAPQYLSLVLDEQYVQAAVWSYDARGKPTIEKSATERMDEDSWEARVEAGDRALSSLDSDGSVGSLHDVVLGLSSVYLTDSGDIDASVRPHVRHLCKELDLTPIGFVSLPQAVVHKLKADEGVPPTTILLFVSDGKITVSLYKIGVLAGQHIIDTDDVVAGLESTLKAWKDIEVLPSRMLLYGTDSQKLEELKHTLLKHPWPTRVAFLHFPKIDLLPPEFAVEAVCLAGAGELSTQIAEEPAQEEEEPNVVMVEPEALGFAKGKDVLEEVEEVKPQLPKVVIPSISADRVREVISTIHLPTRGGPIAGVALLLFIVLGVYVWFFPHATVTVYTLPHILEKSTTISINPSATVADAATKTIPGKSQEKVVSGEKTAAVTGKKDIGDPAKGTVTVYNKVTSQRSLQKGTQLTSGGIAFTLDDDVKVASASESIGSITFGKASAAVTAVVIGTKGNLPTNTEFTVKDIPASQIIARNDQPFTGGTSKEVTVVSRADYDAMVKSLTSELVEKAKKELGSAVAGKEKLIDATIKSAVKEKVFQEELDQEAKELHGTLTVVVTGTSYTEEDIATLFQDMVAGEIPAGYALMAEQTALKNAAVTVKKDGTMIVAATIRGVALPTLNSMDLVKNLAGKDVKGAEQYLRSIRGVAGMEVGYRWSPLTKRLPWNNNNISLSIALQE